MKSFEEKIAKGPGNLDHTENPEVGEKSAVITLSIKSQVLRFASGKRKPPLLGGGFFAEGYW